MVNKKIIAAIELGSSKIRGLVGEKDNNNEIKILAYAEENSLNAIKKGTVYNLNTTAEILTSIINQLEFKLGNATIDAVYAIMNGQSIRTIRNVIGKNLDENTIISKDIVDSITEENITIPIENKLILGVAPQEYKIGNNFQIDPIGVASDHIEGRFLNIISNENLKKNLIYSFKQAKIELKDLLVGPLITANGILTESEKRSGCALIDFGAEVTSVSIYKNNVLRYLTVIPLGSYNITKDLTNLQLEEEEAEEFKVNFGNATYKEPDNNETPNLCSLEHNDKSVNVKELNQIIQARLEEIMANVWNQIQYSGYDDKLLSGIIITGGGSNMQNLIDYIKQETKIDRIRKANTINYNIENLLFNGLKNDSTKNCILSSLLAGTENCCTVKIEPTQPIENSAEVNQQNDTPEENNNNENSEKEPSHAQETISENEQKEEINKVETQPKKHKRKIFEKFSIGSLFDSKEDDDDIME